MSDTRGTLGSFFSAIQALMTALTSLFATADRGVQMLDTFTVKAQTTQKIHARVDLAAYEIAYEEAHAKKVAEQRGSIRRWAAADPSRLQDYNEALAIIRATREPKQNE